MMRQAGRERTAKHAHHVGPIGAAVGGARWNTVAGAICGLLVAVAGLAFSSHVLAAYYTPRVALLYPLTAVLAIAWLIRQRPRMEVLSIDALDLAVAAFLAWQIIAALAAPVWTLAWFGAYNRLGGTVLWLALGLMFVVTRRALSAHTAQTAFAWLAGAVVSLAAVIALLQAAGQRTPWEFENVWFGRAAGTTGNPLNLAGLCLVSVLFGVLATDARRRPPARLAAVVACLLGLTGIVLAESRAAYLSLLCAAVLLAAVWLAGRRWRLLAGLVLLAALVSVAALTYNPGAGALGARLSIDPGAATYGLSQPDLSRGTFWRVAGRAIAARPWLGYGPGGYVVAYRRFVPAAALQASPLSSVSDPHSLPLLVAAGSGLPGLALAVAVAALVALAMAPRLRLRLQATPASDGSQDRLVLGAAGSLLALFVFLMLSPSDPAALVPCVLLAALASGPPQANSRLCLPMEKTRTRSVAWLGLLALSVAALVATSYLGLQLYRADADALRAATSHNPGPAVQAVRLMPSVPVYGLIAWTETVRLAVARGRDETLLRGGESYLRSSLADDPTAASTRVAEVRYYLIFGETDEAMAEIRLGLRTNPSNPLLQGLWGYIAQALAADRTTRSRAEILVGQLRAFPPTTADGWYWLGVASQAIGEGLEGQRALDVAHRLAPALVPSAYLNRLQGNF